MANDGAGAKNRPAHKKKEHQAELGDFTLTAAHHSYLASGNCYRADQHGPCLAAAALDRAGHQPLLLSAFRYRVVVPFRQSSRLGGHCDSCHWIAHRRPHGALRFGKDSRTRHARSHRIHSDERQPRGSETGAAEAVVGGYFHRFGRPVRRRRSHHHDGRRIGLHDRAVLPSHRSGT